MNRRSHRTVPTRGALLLEVLLALALFVTAGMAILSMVGQSVGSLRAARDEQHAADLARSAMAKIEAGIETAEVLNGPVPAWREETDADADGNAGKATEWELSVQTAPSNYPGLTLVTVIARKSAGAGTSYTLKQLVRALAKAEDEAGGMDDVAAEAARGAKLESPSGRGSGGNGPGSRPARPGNGGGQ